MFDDLMAQKICMDVHIFSKNTISLFRNLFSFSQALLICSGNKTHVTGDLFSDVFNFMNKGVTPITDPNIPLSLDFQALPQILMNNLNSWPKLFK
jgi:hypothetical protein